MSAHNALYELNQPAIDDFGGKILDYGITKPTDGVAGFAPGCIFIHVDGGDGSALYVNEGTATSADFNLITVAAA
jgi:hypothetical protein